MKRKAHCCDFFCFLLLSALERERECVCVFLSAVEMQEESFILKFWNVTGGIMFMCSHISHTFGVFDQ